MIKKRKLLIKVLLVIFTISTLIYKDLNKNTYHIETIIKDTPILCTKYNYHYN